MNWPLRFATASGILVVAACSTVGVVGPAPVPPSCVPGVEHVSELDSVPASLADVDTWLDLLAAGEADRVLLSPAAIQVLNDRNRRTNHGFKDVLLAEVADDSVVSDDLRERLEWLRQRIADKRLVEGQPGSFDAARTLVLTADRANDVRLVHREATLWCVPLSSGLYSVPIDRDFDRNRCSGLHPGELVRVLRTSADDWLYVHAGHSVGWVKSTVATPPIAPQAAQTFRDGQPRAVATDDDGWLRMGMSFPIVRDDADGLVLLVPASEGLVERRVSADIPISRGYLPFTKRNVWTLALRQVGREYGWGGRAGHRDCSRLILDVMAAFGVRLGRHSGYQSKSGSSTVSLRKKDEQYRKDTIRRSAESSVVLLYMNGHIMMYLGTLNGVPYGVSSLSEFLLPCSAGRRVVRLDRVAVSDLELGRGTERTAFLERLRRLAVFGQ